MVGTWVVHGLVQWCNCWAEAVGTNEKLLGGDGHGS